MSEPPVAVDVLGVRIHPVTRSQLLTLLTEWVDGDVKRRLYYANARVLNLACVDSRFRRSLNAADLVIAEGYGAKLGANILAADVPEQLATMDWMDSWLLLLAERRLKVFLLGDEPGVAEACAEKMIERNPGLRVVGTHHGFFDKTGPENNRVIQMINGVRPDVLMVGFGNPTQEFWIDRHLELLEARVFCALGAMFRWYSGAEHRAPAWMRALHLEWFLRLLRHPVRHFRRYVLGNPLFLWRVAKQRWSQM